jgi:sterol carrier protein 2
VEQAFVGYCYGDSTSGQRALYSIGMTGIPIVNVNNNCSTGSTALYLAKNAIASGSAEVALALGFEKMASGSLASTWTDRANPLEPHLTAISAKHDLDFKKPMAPTIFGLAGMEYCEQHGVKDPQEQRRIMSQIAWKNHMHRYKIYVDLIFLIQNTLNYQQSKH